MMVVKNDVGLNKGGFVFFKRIERIFELVYWVFLSDDVQNYSWDYLG